MRVTARRGEKFEMPRAAAFLATVHPSSDLRAPPGDRAAQEALFRGDISRVAAVVSDLVSKEQSRGLAPSARQRRRLGGAGGIQAAQAGKPGSALVGEGRIPLNGILTTKKAL